MSHYEIRVADLAPMLAFYTETLGFVITDRGADANGLVFLSRSAHEHHQIVLNPDSRNGDDRRFDHVAFRVPSLNDLRSYQAMLADTEHETVTHGTTWSLYFFDPEENRLEIFCDTPWYVEQPTRLPIDLAVTDDELHQNSRRILRSLPGFTPYSTWLRTHRSDIAETTNIEMINPPTMFTPIGPYSHATRSDDHIHVSGTPGVEADNTDDVHKQTIQTLDNLSTILDAAGSSTERILHIHVYLKDIANFEAMNAAYREYFESSGDYLPARTVVGVNDLPRPGALLTMNATATTDPASPKQEDIFSQTT